MSTFSEDLQLLLLGTNLKNKTRDFSETLLHTISKSMSTNICGDTDSEHCRDDSGALYLKLVAVAAILVAGIAGVAIPLVGKRRKFLRTDGNIFVATKAFAAGVILATGFVHMLPDGMAALKDPCLPKNPWGKFPFSGFIAMMASLATLVADFVGTQFYERKHATKKEVAVTEIVTVSGDSGVSVVPVNETGRDRNGKVFGEEEGGGMHIVGIHAHAASHRHSHPQEEGACDGHAGHSHVHGTGGDGAGVVPHVRHVVVSQILELGIVSHSVIIGLSLGVSQSPCTIRPLIAALSFHQFFEGFALGGCISQAQFNAFTSTLMAFFFAITTPIGIGLGIAVSSSYNPDTPRALVVEGIFDSISAGILVYMALVDLIAADFLSTRMSCNVRLQVVSYFALFLGAALMSSLAIWA